MHVCHRQGELICDVHARTRTDVATIWLGCKHAPMEMQALVVGRFFSKRSNHREEKLAFLRFFMAELRVEAWQHPCILQLCANSAISLLHGKHSPRIGWGYGASHVYARSKCYHVRKAHIRGNLCAITYAIQMQAHVLTFVRWKSIDKHSLSLAVGPCTCYLSWC